MAKKQNELFLKLSDTYSSLVPHMKDYYRIGPLIDYAWLPYIMYFQKPHYTSPSINTDSRGFRLSYFNDTALPEFEKLSDTTVNIILGGSTTFGVGATHDQYTLASFLGSSTGEPWLNFGAQTFNSTQEHLLFLFHHQHFKKINNVILFSGLNNLYIYYLSQRFSSEYGTFFYWNEFNKKMNNTPLGVKQRLFKILHAPFCRERYDYAKITFRNIFDFLFNKKSREELRTIDAELFKIINDHDEDKNMIFSILKRDLTNWATMTKALGCKVYYVLQPCVGWLQKKLTQEEHILFGELKKHQTPYWRRITEKKINRERYHWYASELKNICSSLDIPFLDMNAAFTQANLDKMWLFIDNAHLTDRGNEITAQIMRKSLI